MPYATYAVVLGQLRGILKAAIFGYGWVAGRTVIDPKAPEELRERRADPVGFGSQVPIDATIKSLFAPSYLASRSEKALSQTKALLRDAEMQKKRVPSAMAPIQERRTPFVPFPLSANGALGPAANSFLRTAFSHVKIASEFGMRHSHTETASTWSAIWLSRYWRQKIAAAVTATNAVFIGRILSADSAAACGGFKANRPSRYPRYYFFDPRRARKSMAPPLA